MALSLSAQLELLLTANRRTHGEQQYTVPSVDSYPYQWFWDSCFHAILLTYFDHAAAKAELRALVSKQYPDGMIPHVIYWEDHNNFQVEWGKEGTSSLIQPPLIAYAVWRVYAADRSDESFLSELYPSLVRYYDYLLTVRDPDRRNLMGLINPDESGEDNSPRFDLALGLSAQHTAQENTERRYALFTAYSDCHFDISHCMKGHCWIEDATCNAYLVWNLSVMERIALHLGNQADALRFRTKRGAVAAAMRRHLFYNDAYYTRSGPARTLATVKTWSLFAPLIAGLYTTEEAAALVRNHLTNPATFWTPHLLPTVAADEPSFNPDEPTWGEAWQHPDWRGSIWMAANWITCQGLRRYGFHREADAIRASSEALITEHGFRENYHPETGIGMGAHGFTWGGLVIDM